MFALHECSAGRLAVALYGRTIVGMFDTYRPAKEHVCPACGTPLTEWQGKDAQCALFVWKEGIAFPIEHPVAEECQFSQEELAVKRLPDQFEIYSYDCPRHHPINARCKCTNGVWSVTEIETYAV